MGITTVNEAIEQSVQLLGKLPAYVAYWVETQMTYLSGSRPREATYGHLTC